MPLTKKGKKIKKEMEKQLVNLAMFQSIASLKMYFVMAVWADSLEIRPRMVIAIEIFVMAFQNLGDRLISTYFALLHLLSRQYSRWSNFVCMPKISKPRGTCSATKFNIFLVCFRYKHLTAMLAYTPCGRLSKTLISTFVTTAVLLFTRRHCFKWLSTYLTCLQNLCNNQSLTPSYSPSSIFSQSKFITFCSHIITSYYIIPQREGNCQCL